MYLDFKFRVLIIQEKLQNKAKFKGRVETFQIETAERV